MNHLKAKALVDNLVPANPRLNLLTRVVGKLESGYGTASYKGAGSKRITGTNNWGAITGTYHGAYFEAVDSRYDSKQGKVVTYTTKFRLYPTAKAGAADLARLLETKYAAAVDAVPDWKTVSQKLYGYYLGTASTPEASQAGWQARAEEVATEIQAATKESFPPVNQAGFDTPIALVATAGVVAGGIWLLRRGMRRKVKAMR